jgi:hypothetical protein
VRRKVFRKSKKRERREREKRLYEKRTNKTPILLINFD